MCSYKAILTVFSLLAGLSPAWSQSGHEGVGKTVNSSANEQNPILSEDGNTLYFTRQNHPENAGGRKDAGDIWYSERQADGNWSEAVNAGSTLNNQFANSIIGLADNGQTLFLQGHYLPGNSKPQTQGISVSRKTGSGWSVPEPLEIPYYYTKSDHQSGTLHSSGNIMVVTLQSYDTRGAEDLYVLFRKSDGSWTAPRNLGNDINTAYQEMTPFLAPDGKTLYFASNGYEGFGSRDIYQSVRLDDTWKRWSNPENLGAGVNTEGTELFYFLPDDNSYAYLTSTQNSDGLGDIQRVPVKEEELQVLQEKDTFDVIAVEEKKVTEAAEIPETEETVTISGRVLSRTDQSPLRAKIFFRELLEDSTSFQESGAAQSNGSFELKLRPGQNYELMVSAEGFIKEREKVLLQSEEADAVLQQPILLTPIEVGATVNLENVLFDRGTAHMLPGSEENLNEVVYFLKENPAVVIEVAGHTDNQGRADLNQQLSEERAKAVKTYLVSQGIAESRVVDKGYGGSKPLVSNAIEEERRKNRRVEFTILKK